MDSITLDFVFYYIGFLFLFGSIQSVCIGIAVVFFSFSFPLYLFLRFCIGFEAASADLNSDRE